MSGLLYVVMFVALVVIIVLLNLYLRFVKPEKDAKKELKAMEDRKKQAFEKGLLIQCPLCSSDIAPGDDLISRVYRPMNVPHQLCTINGCPNCYPKVTEGLKRVCPHCRKEVPVEGGHLIARLFNKSDGKKHVAIMGCNKCCASGKDEGKK